MRVPEDSGFSAVATRNSGILVSLQYTDGETMPKNEMIAAVWRIAENRPSRRVPI